jgi:hypothetical protein
VGEAGEDDLLQFMRLFSNGFRDVGVGVPMCIYPPGTDAIQNFPSVFGVQKFTFGPVDADFIA